MAFKRGEVIATLTVKWHNISHHYLSSIKVSLFVKYYSEAIFYRKKEISTKSQEMQRKSIKCVITSFLKGNLLLSCHVYIVFATLNTLCPKQLLPLNGKTKFSTNDLSLNVNEQQKKNHQPEFMSPLPHKTFVAEYKHHTALNFIRKISFKKSMVVIVNCERCKKKIESNIWISYVYKHTSVHLLVIVPY